MALTAASQGLSRHRLDKSNVTHERRAHACDRKSRRTSRTSLGGNLTGVFLRAEPRPGLVQGVSGDTINEAQVWKRVCGFLRFRNTTMGEAWVTSLLLRKQTQLDDSAASAASPLTS